MNDPYPRWLGESPAAAKAKWRAVIRGRLSTLDPETARDAAERLANRVMELPEIEGSRGVLVCLSFGAEIDTWGLVERLLQSGRQVFVPRAVSRTRRLHLHPYPCDLKELSFGLRQPVADAAELPSDEINSRVDAALVSALAFDRRGCRLGYGGGFFDRFLDQRPFPAIGIAYDVQIVDRLPMEPHDIPMDRVITEASLWRGP